MDAFTILQIVLGFAFGLFIPGYIMVRLFFSDLNKIEQVAVAIALSIATDIAIGIFLGYNKAWAQVTGGITQFTVWRAMLVVTAVLAIALFIKLGVQYAKTHKKAHKG